MTDKSKRGSWHEPTPEWGDRVAEILALTVSVCLFAAAAWISIPAALIAYLAGWIWAGTKWVQRQRHKPTETSEESK